MLLTCALLHTLVSESFTCADPGLFFLNLILWCQTHINVATHGQFHQAGDNGHLCHRKTTRSSPLVYNKPASMVYLSTHNSQPNGFCRWMIPFCSLLLKESSMANFGEVTQGFYFPSHCHSWFTINFPTHLSSTGMDVSSIVAPQNAACPLK